MKLDDIALIGVAGLGAWWLLSSDPSTPNWTFDEVSKANERLKQLGVRVIMLGDYASNSSPYVLIQRNVMNPGAQLKLVNDLATAVFTFRDRPREYYRALGSEWVHDITTESYVNQRG